MIPFLPDQPAATGLNPRLPFQPGAGAGTGVSTDGRTGGGALDFAGLLDAVLPAEVGLVPDAGMPPELAPAPLIPALDEAPPPGTNLPDSGEDLPPSPIMLLPVPLPAANMPEPQVPGSLAETPAISDAAPPPRTGVLVTDILESLHVSLPALVSALPQPETAEPATVGPVSAGPVPAGPVPAGPVPAASLPAAPVLPAASLPASLRSAGGPRPLALAGEAGKEEAAADPAPLPGVRAEASEAASAPGAGSAPGAPASSASSPAPALAQTPAAAASPLAPTERAEPRASAPQLETTIAQVGEIREALRAARPEMTLRHAEFGFVSLRLEATGAAQDWRAVLASRDPGFVPAIQAALAERAVAASAETSGTGTNSNGAGQGQSGSGSEQRYGSSPGSGQGSSQPYFAQSSQRDEGADQHQRNQQQRRADEAGTGAGSDAGAAERRERGLFA